jgi:hypothetical protein
MEKLFKLPKLVLLQSREYKWIKSVLKSAKRHGYIRDCIMKNESCVCLSDKNHTNTSKAWTISMAREIFKNDLKIKKHTMGYVYKE